mgnify:CR=1 FL=1
MPRTWLAPRECEVLCRLAKKDGRRLRGSTFKWIAKQMGISENAARSAAKRAYHKLGAHGRTEAIVLHPPHKITPSESCYPFRTEGVPQKPAARPLPE